MEAIDRKSLPQVFFQTLDDGAEAGLVATDTLYDGITCVTTFAQDGNRTDNNGDDEHENTNSNEDSERSSSFSEASKK